MKSYTQYYDSLVKVRN